MSHIDEGELTAYADGAYAPGEGDALRIEAHLAECANCRNRLAQAQTLTARASEIIAIATPLNVTPVPFETIAARNTKTTTRFMPYAWAASLILAVGLGWLMRDSLTMQEPQAPQIATAPSAAAPQSIQNDAKVETAETKPTQTAPTARAEQPATGNTINVAAAPPPPAAAPSVVSEMSDASSRLASAGNASSGQGAARLELEARAVTVSDTLHVIPGLEIVSSHME
ncbi:MAG TPA: zf-HC2 domain-containing protein, partial [Longimicrobiales bacterium]|nr:zf-HC2 domain-containing protein [Longimicrobiales bacterium]